MRGSEKHVKEHIELVDFSFIILDRSRIVGVLITTH
jgi:hypothetical protein